MHKEDKLVSLIFSFLSDQDNCFFKMKKHFIENPKDAINILTIGEDNENSDGVQLQKSNRRHG